MGIAESFFCKKFEVRIYLTSSEIFFNLSRIFTWRWIIMLYYSELRFLRIYLTSSEIFLIPHEFHEFSRI